MSHFAVFRNPTLEESSLEKAHHEEIERFGVALGIDFGHLTTALRLFQDEMERSRDLLGRSRDLGGERFCEFCTGQDEGSRGLGAVRVSRLRGDAANPFANGGFGRGRAFHPAREITRESANPLVEDRDEELALATEMAIERLVRKTGFGEDVAHGRFEASRASDHGECGRDQATDLVGGRGASPFDGSVDGLSDDRVAGGPRGAKNWLGIVVLHIENGILKPGKRKGTKNWLRRRDSDC